MAERDAAGPGLRVRCARGADRPVRHPRVSRADRLRRRLHRIPGRHDLPGEGPRSAVLRRGIRPDACRGAVAGRLGRTDPRRAPRARLITTYTEKTANTPMEGEADGHRPHPAALVP